MQQVWGTNATDDNPSPIDTTKPVQVVGQRPSTTSSPLAGYESGPATRPGQTTNWWSWYGGQGNNTNPTPNTQPTGNAQIPVPSNPLTPGGTAGNYLGGISGIPTYISTPGSVMPTGTSQAELATNWQNWVNTATPYLQLQQNAYQYAQDYNEAMRRWNEQTAWQQAADAYNMALTGRQQNMAEWQAQEAARQWQEAQNYQQQRDAAEMALSRDMTMQQVWGRNQMPNVKWIRGGGAW